MAGQEQIYKHHQQRNRRQEVAAVVEQTAGGPDDITLELQIDTTRSLEKIARVLGETCVQAD
jgi:hypothetical protein